MMLMSDKEPAHYVLYADDDSDDQDMVRELLPEILPHVELIVKDNGEDVIQFINELPADAHLPSLIVLDLNMPGWDGIQTLSIIKRNKQFQHVPVLLFSTTANETDRDRAFLAGAVAFVTKPSRYSDFKTIIESFAAHLKS
jgi:CheY-like chemotaxis protein